MNAARSVTGLLLVSAAAFGAIGGLRWRSAFSHSLRASARLSGMPTSTRMDSAVIDSSVAVLVDNDPFRFSNTPPSVRFDPAADAPMASIAAPIIRPHLVLKAIVGGPPWSAVIDGLPGQPPGVVVHTGSRFDQLAVSAVTRDSVIVRATDTVWVLRFGGRS